MTAQERLAAALKATAMATNLGADQDAADILAADQTLAQDIELGQRVREATERMDAGRWIAWEDIPRPDDIEEAPIRPDRYVTEFRTLWPCPQHGTCVGCDEARTAAARERPGADR